MKRLQYGDIVKFPCSPFSVITPFGFGLVSSSDEQVLVDVKVEKYWDSDETLTYNTFKVKLLPEDSNYASVKTYFSDIAKEILKHNPEYDIIGITGEGVEYSVRETFLN